MLKMNWFFLLCLQIEKRRLCVIVMVIKCTNSTIYCWTFYLIIAPIFLLNNNFYVRSWIHLQFTSVL
jgi:hypothetical protein